MTEIRPRILIADDQPDNLLVLDDLLGERYAVRTVNSGRQVLELMAGPVRPDLLLLDVVMPDPDGFEVCRRLKEMPECRDVPVIFLTGLGGIGDEERGLALGADDFIHKPFVPALVLARVRNLLGRREATLHQHQTAMVEARLAEQEKVAATLQGVVDRLTVMNTELDRFAFVAAHDLREPLRSVINFSQVLGRQCGDRLGPEEQRSLRHIIDGAKRMYDLVGGLLEYSRVSANMGLPRRGSSACACAMAIENLAAIIEETDAVVTVAEDLPEIGIDEPPLVRVFQNLIGNALKFRHPDRRPQVAVTARLECQAAVFSITDNGIGFEPGEQDVFELFRQLHRHEGFGGAGVGLAISKRIIQGLGGRIWVESEHGQGSTFTFTLPAPPRR